MRMPKQRSSSERGQVLIIVAAAIVVIIAMVGLVVDGGFAWGQQRQVQNAADAISEAGTVQLAANLAGVAPQRTDADIASAVQAAADANKVPTPTACYTNFNGHPIDGTGAVTANARSCTGAALVGNASNAIPPGTWGVRAESSRTFNTFLMRVIGFSQLTTTATATSRTGYSAGTCDAAAGCIVLPVTVPVTIVSCDSSGDAQTTQDPYLLDTLYVIPLCKGNPGNVGWIDWTPKAGGTSELIQSILTPNNPDLKWPGWYYITSTGNVNSKGVEDALRTYDGKVVSFPNFDATCASDPTGPTKNDCNDPGGNGSNQWYHIGAMASFTFCSSSDADCAAVNVTHGAYINGSNKVPCDTGNGATSCLAGKFVKQEFSGEVTAAPPPGCDSSDPNYSPAECLSSVNVQLIH